MLYTIPDYYNEFACIAGACPDTCCAGWQIAIDKKSLKKYRKYREDFSKQLRTSVDWKEGVFRQKNKRCAFLNDENLCDIYINAGADMLCETCRKYPRHVEEYEDLREISLSLSCPVVAGLLMNRTQPVCFLTKEREMQAEEYEEFDYMLFTKLCDAREVMFSVLQDRTADIRIRIAMVLSLGHDLQRRIDGGRLFEVDELLERYKKSGATDRFAKKCQSYMQCDENRIRRLSEEMFYVFDELEVLKADFPEYLKERRALSGVNGKKISDEEAVCLEQIMVYFIYTYFCGAVYDEQAYGKVKFAVVSTILIRSLYLGDERCAQKTEKQAMIEAAYRYSKEVEHSDPNLVTMEKILLRDERYSLINLLCVLGA